MTTEIHMSGQTARIMETTLLREVPIEDLLAELENRPPIVIGPLPHTAVMFRFDESNPDHKRATFLCEQPAQMRSLRYANRRYDLSVPWTYFVYDYETRGNPSLHDTAWQVINIRVFWAREQVRDSKSELARALVPNCDHLGGICYGGTLAPTSLPLGQRLDRMTMEFYRSTFTHDSGTGSPWQSETGSNTWTEWAKQSKDDPNAWKRFPEWDSKKATLGHGKIDYTTVSEAMGKFVELDLSKPIEVVGAIPERPYPATFGRLEEYLRGEDWTPETRHRLLVALQNMGADDPGLIAAPPRRRGRAEAEPEDFGTPIHDDEDPI